MVPEEPTYRVKLHEVPAKRRDVGAEVPTSIARLFKATESDLMVSYFGPCVVTLKGVYLLVPESSYMRYPLNEEMLLELTTCSD